MRQALHLSLEIILVDFNPFRYLLECVVKFKAVFINAGMVLGHLVSNKHSNPVFLKVSKAGQADIR